MNRKKIGRLKENDGFFYVSVDSASEVSLDTLDDYLRGAMIMGCFGYICKGCGTPINGDCLGGGEKCIMIHVRHGEELGRVEGHYNEYGRVVEQDTLKGPDKFRGETGPNSHEEICISEFELDDSVYSEEKRIYKNTAVTLADFTIKYFDDNPDAYLNSHTQTGPIQFYREEFFKLPSTELEARSGIVAWHSACYQKATEEERKNLIPSQSDSNQSWGKIRKKYC